MIKPKYIAFLLAMLVTFHVKSQEKVMNWHAEATYHYGFLLAHRSNVQVLVKDYSKSLEFTLAKKFSGKEDWEVKYAYPYAGISFMMLDFGNPEQLGKGYSLFGFYNFPIVSGERFEFNFKIGFGPGYVEKVFDKKDNYKNQVVSAHFNGFAFGNFNAKYTFAEQYTLSGGISISHFSNAAARKPNLGINVPAINVGLGYRFKEVDKVSRDKDYAFDYDKSWNHDLVAGGGRKANEIEGPEYGIFSLAYALTRRFSFKSRLGAGADLFYNSAHRGLTNEEGYEISTGSDIFQMGVNVSYMLQINQLGLFINQGFYLYDKWKDDGPIYHRMGFRYLVKDQLILNVSMKTHWAVADHVELGIGYRIK